MKICWDNLEGLRYDKEKGIWYDKHWHCYTYIESCENCGDSFLAIKDASFCSIKCATSGKHNAMFGKTGDKNPFFGKKHTKENLKRIGSSSKDRNTGPKNGNWNKYTHKNLPTYDIYAHQLKWCEEVR